MKKQKLAFILALGTLFSSCSTNQPGISLKECLGHDMNQSDYYVSYNMSKYQSATFPISWERISTFFEVSYASSTFDSSIFLSNSDMDYNYCFYIHKKNETAYDRIYVYEEKAYVVNETENLIYQSTKRFNVKKLTNELEKNFNTETWAKASRKERKSLIYLFVDQYNVKNMTYDELKAYLGNADRLEKMVLETYPTMDGGTDAYYFFADGELASSYFKVHYYENKTIDSYVIQ